MCKAKYLLFFLFISSSLLSCSKEEDNIPEWPWKDQDSSKQEANPAIIKLGWSNQDSLYGTLPDAIHVYRNPEKLKGKMAIAYIAVADMRKAHFDVVGDIGYSSSAKGYGATSLNTLDQFYAKNKVPIIINGGLFYESEGFYHTQNLVIKNKALLAPNQNYYSEDWVTMWYPTLGAFCEMEDGTFKTMWTYFTSKEENYAYSSPAENDITKTPLEAPSLNFPVTGQMLKAKTGIGGVTVLINNGKIVNSYIQEMLDIAAASNQPRTAVGITSDNKMVFFVCEGREMTEGVLGLTTADLAAVMQSLGCVEALNLDGGGSSNMLINGKSTIKPSDGKSRPVLTAVSLQ